MWYHCRWRWGQSVCCGTDAPDARSRRQDEGSVRQVPQHWPGVRLHLLQDSERSLPGTQEALAPGRFQRTRWGILIAPHIILGHTISTAARLLANANFSFVIASQRKIEDALGFPVEWAELPQQAHSILWWPHGLAGLANAEFSFVISYQEKMADAVDFSVEWAELPQQAHNILWWRWLTGVWPPIADPANRLMTLIAWHSITNCQSS